ncbi:MAG: hypothetical protein LW700_04360 [Gemmataceae bacterium]|jgi:hypothetical protein|nr:hypothetical protein [Gemmataceae bacterium]
MARVKHPNPSASLEDCTVPEKILLSAHDLEKAGETPFSAEALIVASWKRYPKTFGLKGFAEHYPDSNKILASIMGEKGLAKKGWLNKVGQKMYVLTADGKKAVQRLQAGEGPPPPPVRTAPPSAFKGLPGELDSVLVRLLDSEALYKHLEDRKQDIAFGDALQFWGLPEKSKADEIDNQLSVVRKQLDESRGKLEKSSLILTNGRSISKDDVDLLTQLHSYLQERFARHLNLMRQRAVKS